MTTSQHESVVQSIRDHAAARDASETCYVAFSGGMDSAVLLHAICQVYPLSRLCLIHINHGIHPNAADWADSAQAQANNYGIRAIIETLDSAPPNHNLENWARKQRYQVFSTHCKAPNRLLLAHHQRDQAETFLLRLMRGAGLQGLQGMKPHRAQGSLLIDRPLLTCAKEAIEAYAVHYQLQWVDDPSNTDIQFDRNYLRHQVLPVLDKRWPQSDQTLAQQAFQHQHDYALLGDLLHEKLSEIQNSYPTPDTPYHSVLALTQRDLAIVPLKTMPRNQAYALIRHWLQQDPTLSITKDTVNQIWETVIEARPDASPQVTIQRVTDADSVIICRYQDRLYQVEDIQVEAVHQQWDGRTPYHWPQAKAPITIAYLETMGVDTQLLDFDTVEIRTLPTGLRAKPAGRSHSQQIKKLLQAYQVPPWERPHLPTLWSKGELAAVLGVFVCEGFQHKHYGKGHIS